MKSPFPGMDPYLEDPAIWFGFHHSFLTAMQERIAPAVRPKYFVRVEERVYVATEADPAYRLILPDLRVIEAQDRKPLTPPAGGGLAIAEPIPVPEVLDPEVHEHRLEILDRVDRSVVTVIELLSPTNKLTGSVGRESFLQKRREVFAGSAHRMEIDLLRDGVRTTNLAATAGVEYQVFLSRAGRPRRGWAWPVALRARLPVIGVPLHGEDPDVPLDLQAAFDHVYEICGYDLDIDYGGPPVPPLSAGEAQWAAPLITGHRAE